MRYPNVPVRRRTGKQYTNNPKRKQSENKKARKAGYENITMSLVGGSGGVIAPVFLFYSLLHSSLFISFHLFSSLFISFHLFSSLFISFLLFSFRHATSSIDPRIGSIFPSQSTQLKPLGKLHLKLLALVVHIAVELRVKVLHPRIHILVLLCL
jgi:hypothetical protein